MMGSASLCFFNMEKINVFDVQVPDGETNPLYIV